VEELQDDLDTLGPFDCDQVTFAGLGEPTLARNLPALVEVVRSYVDTEIAILTGSGLLPRPDVRRDLLHFDHVVAKLDAPSERLMQQINRPGAGFPYSWTALVDGIRRFRETFTGRMSLQMMFLQANARTAPQMAELARSLGADEIHLDTPLQPALGGPVSAPQMASIEQAFSGLPAHVTVRSIYHAGQARATPRML
jgi:wyosine [tRNA(Phe)-imidazoG37] synthetase (radical SAM superfamily)